MTIFKTSLFINGFLASSGSYVPLTLDMCRTYPMCISSFGNLSRKRNISQKRNFSITGGCRVNNVNNVDSNINNNVNNPSYPSDVSFDNAFSSIIPSKYVFSKNNPLLLYFDLFQLENKDYFYKTIEANVSKDVVYTVFIKIRYNIDSFFMAGSQFGFQYKNSEDVNNILFAVNGCLEDYFSEYNLRDESVSYIQLSFRKLDTVLLKEFVLNKPDNLSEIGYSEIKRRLNIPLSINEKSLGKPLETLVDINNNITYCFHGK
jgi:hypothetical protein